jgi:tRNA nucleotidyltransferase/poly(A) polymerase
MKKRLKAQKPPADSKPRLSSEATTNMKVGPSKWIRISRTFSLPSYVREAVARLNQSGHQAYVVGGSVRDFLLGIEEKTKDHDLATSALPDEICELFPNSITVGKAFGVIKVPLPHSEGSPSKGCLEIATFRRDIDYRDHRRPERVEFSSPEEDAKRRDFTINGMFFDLKTNRILDFVGGSADLEMRLVRSIGDPQLRFNEDALRLLRAVRFATSLEGFSLEAETLAAVRAKSHWITRVSGERVFEELNRMLCGPHPASALRLLLETELYQRLFPESESSNPKTVEGVLERLHHLSELDQPPTPEVRWGALLYDLFLYHPSGRNACEKIFERLKFSNDLRDRVTQLLTNQIRVSQLFKMREANLARFVRERDFGSSLTLFHAERLCQDGNSAQVEFGRARLAAFEAAQSRGQIQGRFIEGKDLIQLGMEPGPRFSEILKVLEDLALEGEFKNKDEALEYVLKHYVR